MTNIKIDEVELYRFSFPKKCLNEYNRFSYINKTKYRGAVILMWSLIRSITQKINMSNAS